MGRNPTTWPGLYTQFLCFFEGLLGTFQMNVYIYRTRRTSNMIFCMEIPNMIRYQQIIILEWWLPWLPRWRHQKAPKQQKYALNLKWLFLSKETNNFKSVLIFEFLNWFPTVDIVLFFDQDEVLTFYRAPNL